MKPNNRYSAAQIYTALYVLLCIIAVVYQIMRPAQDKFAAIFVALLTLPWSVIIALISGYVIYEIFNYEINQITWNVIMLMCVLVNAYIIYRLANDKK